MGRSLACRPFPVAAHVDEKTIPSFHDLDLVRNQGRQILADDSQDTRIMIGRLVLLHFKLPVGANKHQR